MTPSLLSNATLLACVAACLLPGCGGSGGGDIAPAPVAQFDCAAITTLPLPANVRVRESARIEAGTVRPVASADPLPAHCKVQGEINARTGKAFARNPADGTVVTVDAPYAIGFELRLPQAWNGRFFFQGGGGLDGVLAPAFGLHNPQRGAAASALARGFAVVSTDGGHRGTNAFDGNFGADEQARLDYAYNALDQVTITSRLAIEGYYGKPPERSYFVGCSNGGRQGMLASQRFPAHFDGIVAGDPGFNYMPMVANTLSDVLALARAVPPGATTPFGPDLGKVFAPADRTLVQTAILARCDARGRDGLQDGIVADPAACDFDPQVHIATCPGANDGSCLTLPQKTALAAMFAGGKTSTGTPLYSDYFFDAGVGTPGWNVWKLDGVPVPLSPGVTVSLGINQLAGLDGPGKVFSTPANPRFDPFAFDPDTDPARWAEFSRVGSATSADLSAFQARGGKLILYNGNSDPLVSSKDLIRYQQAMTASRGGSVEDFSRLFLVPGMNHCGGGPTTDDIDLLTAIQNWVEQDTPPDAILARAGPATPWPGRTRPLCAYPEVAVYQGSGSIEDAGSFACQ